MGTTRMGLSETLGKASRMVLKRPQPTEILWINFAVTYLCNSRCRMCRIWEKYRQEPGLLKEELSLSEIDSLLSSARLHNLEGIGVTGGEPFLRRDLVDIVGLFIQHNPDALVSIATNGLSPTLIAGRTKEILDRFNPRLLGLSISLDGVGAAHDRMRGIRGAFQRVLSTVEAVQEQCDINLGFDFTITPRNFRDLWSAYELSKACGVKFLAGFAHNSDFYYDNAQTAFEWGPALPEAAGTLQRIAKDRGATESLLEKLTNPNACFMARAPEYESQRTRMFDCHSGVHSLFLDPYGQVYPCIILGEKLGSVREESFDSLWLSERARAIRTGIEQRSCHCWVACEAVPSLLRGLTVPRWNLVNKILKPLVLRLNQHP